MKIYALASAALLGLATFAPAHAAPVGLGHATAAPHGATLVASKKVIVKKNRRGVVKKTVVHKRHFRAGGRYKHAPKGWHRFNNRPGDWHTRGCVIVGPVWWCP